MFIFNQFGDLERGGLRPSNVHKAEGWRAVLEPVVVRYRGRQLRRCFRADAAFRGAGDLRVPGGQGLPVHDPPAEQSGAPSEHRPSAEATAGRPPNHVRRWYASCSYQAGSWTAKRRVVAKVEWHPGEPCPRIGYIVTNMTRPAERVVAFYNQRGPAEQHIRAKRSDATRP